MRGFSSGFILVVGVLLVPLVLVVLTTSYDAPDDLAYIRMAFAQVANATIAIVTVVGLLAQRVLRRSPLRGIAWFAFIAVVVSASQLSTMVNAAETLLTRLAM
jgi:hypothetical protein